MKSSVTYQYYKLYIKLTPNARYFVLKYDDIHSIFSISVPAPPVSGAANKALIQYLADLLRLSKTSITFVRGEGSRYKVLAVYASFDVISFLKNSAISC